LELSNHLVSEKSKNADEILTKLRNSIKIRKGANSDEYVFAGGTRQSDILAQQKATREANKKSGGRRKKEK
jgi:hypothetical protein